MEIPKRLCPFCKSADISPDVVLGNVPEYVCRNCGLKFPAGIEIDSENKPRGFE